MNFFTWDRLFGFVIYNLVVAGFCLITTCGRLWIWGGAIQIQPPFEVIDEGYAPTKMAKK